MGPRAQHNDNTGDVVVDMPCRRQGKCALVQRVLVANERVSTAAPSIQINFSTGAERKKTRGAGDGK